MTDQNEFLDTTEEHFATFKRVCMEWKDRLHLDQWQVYFDHKPLEDCYARCHYRNNLTVATIVLSTKWHILRPLNNVELRAIARHEMLHLLTAELNYVAGCRWCAEDEVSDAEERLVRNIEAFIERELAKPFIIDIPGIDPQSPIFPA